MKFRGVIAVLFGLTLCPRVQACTMSTVNPSVTICTPSNRGIVDAPMHVVAGTTDSHAVKTMKVYLDSVLVYQVGASSLNTYISLPVGPHSVKVQASDSVGATFSKTVSVEQRPPCALNPNNRTVTICTPGPGAIVSLPVHVVAGVQDTLPTTQMQVKVDGAIVASVSAGRVDVYLTNLTPGPHSVAVTARDSSNSTFSNSVNLAVTDNAGLEKIRHIIIFVQENRSFDSYFGRLGQYYVNQGFPNPIDGQSLTTALLDPTGTPVHPYHYVTECTEGLNPYWTYSYSDVDGGKMDNFVKNAAAAISSTIDPNGHRAMGFYDWRDLPYYYALALDFGTSDRWFSSVLTNTIPNRMYMFAGTSFGHVGLDSPPSGTTWSQATIFDHLDATGVSWRYYFRNTNYMQEWSTYTRDSKKVFYYTQFFNDIKNESTLPSVLFIERARDYDEHPGGNVQVGAAYAASFINALLRSPSWASSVFILTYDEGSGLYDHVIPATMVKPDNIKPKTSAPGDFAHTGFRVPLIVISPYARSHFVSHTWRDLTSMLRLIEDRFHVPPLTARDAAADNMMEFFNFTSPPWKTPPQDLPTQPTSGTCKYGLEKVQGSP
jgi:phospholipase C